MRVFHVPLQQLRAIHRACPGLFQALSEAADAGVEPVISVMRIPAKGERTRWYVSVLVGESERVLRVDETDIEAMAAIIPIFLVDLVHELRQEQAEVMAQDGMEASIAKLIPFGSLYGPRGSEKPS